MTKETEVMNPEQRKKDKSEEEPFDSAKFTIPSKFFPSQYDMEEAIKKFANDDVFVLNPDRSMTLIPDNYVDGYKTIERICKLKPEAELRITPEGETVKPKAAATTVDNRPKHKDDTDKPPKRNRQLVKNLTPETNPSADAGQAVNRRSLSQKMTVDDHLWHYILFKHADKVGDICARNSCEAKVVSEFSKQGLSYYLEVSPFLDEKSNVNDATSLVESATEEFAQLFQKVSNPVIMEENVKLPPEMDKTKSDDLRKALDQMGFLLMPSDVHRLIGPESRLKEAKDRVWKVISEHKSKIQSAIKKDTEKDKPLKSAENGIASSENDGDRPLSFHTSNGLAVFVSQGNLVDQRVDAIVNPANCYLDHASGAAGAISRAAGRRLNEESRDYIKNHGPLNTTWVMHTTSGNLLPKIRYVIHAVGPRKTDFTTDEILFEEVKRTVYNCLHYANGCLKIQSIAIPAISSGLFGVPMKIVAEASFAALEEFNCTLSAGHRVLRDVNFLNIDEATVSSMRSTFAALLQRHRESCVDPDGLMDKDDVFGRYAAVFGRELRPTIPDEKCLPRAIATALQRDLGRKVDSFNVMEQIRNEIKSNVLYKNFQQDSWLDRIMNAFTSSSSESPKEADLYLSAAANAFRVEIVLVELDESFSAVERNFKPETSSVKGFDSIYITCSYRGHPHFDALTKVSKNFTTEGPKSNSLSRDQNHSSNVITDQPNGHPNSSSDAVNNDFEKIDKSELSGFPSDNGSSGTSNATTTTTAKTEKETEEDNMCIICMDTITDEKTLPCKHKFCRECIDNCFERHQPKCPSCGKVFGILKGNQPRGTMNVREDKRLHLAGYEKWGSYEIEYSFPSGTQRDNHPNPGKHYEGTHRTAYLPANKEGKEVLDLLRRAFDAGLVFTIGRSNTTGQENVVIWNDVHHKTSFSGQYGYPDPTYLKRVKEELAVKGIQ